MISKSWPLKITKHFANQRSLELVKAWTGFLLSLYQTLFFPSPSKKEKKKKKAVWLRETSPAGIAFVPYSNQNWRFTATTAA